MSSYLEDHIPLVGAADAGTAALVFESVYKVCEDLGFLESFLSIAEKTGEEIETTSVPSIIRQLQRMAYELYCAYVLLCPSIDPGHAEELLNEALIYGHNSGCRIHSINQEAK